MIKVNYRKLRKSDYAAIKDIINDSFSLNRYIYNPNILKSVLNSYLYSCLSEATFTCVAEKEGKVIGVIMGNAKSDYHAIRHTKPVILLGYHSAAMSIKSFFYRNKIDSYKRMHEIYQELLNNSNQHFDGILTLFAVTADCQGLGVGKELLRHLLNYQKEHKTKIIYLYTDSTCNVGFYESQGFNKLGEKEMSMTRDNKPMEMNVYLYGYLVY